MNRIKYTLSPLPSSDSQQFLHALEPRFTGQIVRDVVMVSGAIESTTMWPCPFCTTAHPYMGRVQMRMLHPILPRRIPSRRRLVNHHNLHLTAMVTSVAWSSM